MTRPQTAAETMALAAGFEIWTTGGGCMAFATLLKEAQTNNNDVAVLELMITDDSGTSIDFEPEDRVWCAGISYTDPRGGESLVESNHNMTLPEAIAAALEMKKQADALWEKHYDAQAIAEHESRTSSLTR